MGRADSHQKGYKPWSILQKFYSVSTTKLRNAIAVADGERGASVSMRTTTPQSSSSIRPPARSAARLRCGAFD